MISCFSSRIRSTSNKTKGTCISYRYSLHRREPQHSFNGRPRCIF